MRYRAFTDVGRLSRRASPGVSAVPPEVASSLPPVAPTSSSRASPRRRDQRLRGGNSPAAPPAPPPPPRCARRTPSPRRSRRRPGKLGAGRGEGRERSHRPRIREAPQSFVVVGVFALAVVARLVVFAFSFPVLRGDRCRGQHLAKLGQAPGRAFNLAEHAPPPPLRRRRRIEP